jgi:hypothetical protein
VLLQEVPHGYYNYDDVVVYQRDVLGIDENPRLEARAATMR